MSLASFGSGTGSEPSTQDRPPRVGRAGLELLVDVRSAGVSSAGVTRNISPEGAFVATPWLLPIGERVTLRLAIPGSVGPVVVQAEVRWFRPHAQPAVAGRPGGIGVQFVDPPVGVSLCLAALLRANS